MSKSIAVIYTSNEHMKTGVKNSTIPFIVAPK
jgi:hypothetical protein